ncbi:MAG: hypothetical protein QOF50_137 [Gaiellaceae bacterium]|nr:hypothetical protein [Gaiellaceae bacterium]
MSGSASVVIAEPMSEMLRALQSFMKSALRRLLPIIFVSSPLGLEGCVSGNLYFQTSYRR